jgi:hypothetical protein
MNRSGPTRAVFEIFEPAQDEAALDVLRLWTTVPLGEAASVAFDAKGAAGADMPRWRANFPADPGEAFVELAGGEARLEAWRKALPLAADRLDTFVATRAGGPAFVPSATKEPAARPEAELSALLAELQGGAPTVEFGLGEKFFGGWQQAAQQFQAFLKQLLRSVAHYAWVETSVQGRLLGRTTVGWTGAVQTVWREGLAAEKAAVHQRTLALALASRATVLRVLVVTLQGAVKLSVLLSTPGGVILALPAAWRFINQIVDELEKADGWH